ncbi:MBOAT family protein [Waterburya agarophytonicola K14]|uniref:MBOAT family protein n=1 Tax=Waterburya agarophytonicola KI4 TaxID=2874699 RepID=A0A964BRP9_9CYAN|nr:MBOAT family O-acyltransferase [Waterburya agarophytonicola]MCC0178014.1 MBOAT family protein [Waterburya agarophytonicola KI4]
MFFNSIDFAIFLPVVFCLYWFCFNKSLKIQNLLLLAASYLFYGWWDWRFLSLIVFSSCVDFFIGIKLAESTKDYQRKLLLSASIIVNLGFLGFFKYFNFFVDSFTQAFTLLGTSTVDPILLNIVLPVGISFYTFQTLSYSIDVYKGKLEPTKDIIAFFAFVSFFPQLVAGPIERATNLLPQFYRRRTFNYAQSVDGMRQILWGLFKKMVIADNCAFYANDIFANHSNYSGSTLLVGAFLFTLQIYGDFSGYSDVAIGTSRLFSFELMQNFAFPYFSRDVAEFWRRWHISLSTWFRDYLYIPLGGSKGNTWMKVRNTFIIFVVSGFWHGANWTFIIWGALNALYFLPLLLLKRNRSNLQVVAQGKYLPSLKEFFSILITFTLTVFAWIFFRAESVTQAVSYVNGIFSLSLFSIPEVFPIKVLSLIGIFTLIEWLGREQKYAIEDIKKVFPKPIRWAFYYLIIVAIFSFTGQEQEFIYFQF